MNLSKKNNMKQRLNQFRFFKRAQDGLAYLEFAVSLPFLLLLFMGAVEVTRFIIIAQKVEKASIAMSDLVAQSDTMTTTQLNQLVQAVGQVMQPYTFNTNGYVIVTSVSKNGENPPIVNWQYTGGGSWSHASLIGTTGGTATLPSGFTMEDKETVIVSEVFYEYTPMMMSGVMSTSELYKLAIYRPRLGGLKELGS